MPDQEQEAGPRPVSYWTMNLSPLLGGQQPEYFDEPTYGSRRWLVRLNEILDGLLDNYRMLYDKAYDDSDEETISSSTMDNLASSSSNDSAANATLALTDSPTSERLDQVDTSTEDGDTSTANGASPSSDEAESVVQEDLVYVRRDIFDSESSGEGVDAE
ncbi:uncharacterized protein CCOS01_08490 [Colletotrichum costaricense]|uniref:Uncharacterized protein n=1 Tax=Colletotrichum costaricense TaxID=1209916 RepID=A0AAI9YVY1_9PEZI|nr:uncharacterized protein CCOS01_08490 [Colletotrichum costaricense]KAK1526072.1 hypothetical protein CCOS01_08490 [Colletotrichum costaricense]